MNKQEIQENIAILKSMIPEYERRGRNFGVNALKTAISAFEKQIPKKPTLYGDSEDGKLLCPNCEEDLWEEKECGFNGCPYCLQAIDWSVEE